MQIDSASQILTLSDNERAHLTDCLVQFERGEILAFTPQVHAKALQAASRLSADTLEKITQFRLAPQQYGAYLLIRNAPIDLVIPSVPKSTSAWEKQSSVSEAAHLMFHAALGTIPISYAEENDGDVVATLFPRQGEEQKQQSSGSTVLLELHGENQAHPFPPDVLIISNLQEDGSTPVGTLIAPAAAVTSALSEQEKTIARQEIFRIMPPASFRGVHKDDGRLLPMLRGAAGHEMLNFDAHAMQSDVLDGAQLINKVKQILLEAAKPIYLRRGDILLLDNRKAVHGRIAFEPDYKTPRVNQRSFGVFDAAVTSHLRKPRSTILSWPLFKGGEIHAL